MRTQVFAVAILACHAATAQIDKPEFEVVSIKPLPLLKPGYRVIESPTGGPGTRDPEMFRWGNCSMANLIKKAFGLRPDQFTPPDWMWSQSFLLTAKVPPGATKEQLVMMLQSLLTERFQLAYHFEKKETQGYDLVVAKNGPKLKESVQDPPPGEESSSSVSSAPPRPSIGSDGFPNRLGVSSINGAYKMWLRKQTMGDLANSLTSRMGKSVVDATGIQGTYDITLYWADSLRIANAPAAPGSERVPAATVPGAETGPPLLSALQSQLGLKLESKKLTVDVFVIDHIEKTPTEN